MTYAIVEKAYEVNPTSKPLAYALASLQMSGRGCPPDERAALKLLEKADGGSVQPSAASQLEPVKGENEIPVAFLGTFPPSADADCHSQLVKTRLALTLAKGGSKAALTSAVESLRAAKDFGLPQLTILYGRYLEGDLHVAVDPNDKDLVGARDAYIAACDSAPELGDAKYHFARVLLGELGDEADVELGVAYLRDAARLGSAKAMARLGAATFHGSLGIAVDRDAGVRLMTEAMREGAVVDFPPDARLAEPKLPVAIADRKLTKLVELSITAPLCLAVSDMGLFWALATATEVLVFARSRPATQPFRFAFAAASTLRFSLSERFLYVAGPTRVQTLDLLSLNLTKVLELPNRGKSAVHELDADCANILVSSQEESSTIASLTVGSQSERVLATALSCAAVSRCYRWRITGGPFPMLWETDEDTITPGVPIMQKNMMGPTGPKCLTHVEFLETGKRYSWSAVLIYDAKEACLLNFSKKEEKFVVEPFAIFNNRVVCLSVHGDRVMVTTAGKAVSILGDGKSRRSLKVAENTDLAAFSADGRHAILVGESGAVMTVEFLAADVPRAACRLPDGFLEALEQMRVAVKSGNENDLKIAYSELMNETKANSSMGVGLYHQALFVEKHGDALMSSSTSAEALYVKACRLGCEAAMLNLGVNKESKGQLQDACDLYAAARRFGCALAEENLVRLAAMSPPIVPNEPSVITSTNDRSALLEL